MPPPVESNLNEENLEIIMSHVLYEDLKIALEQQREDLLSELSEMDSHPRSALGYGNHQADDGTAAFEQAADLAMRCNAERLLHEVERALARIAEGNYGTCRNCGKAIDPARLRAIPYARYCLNCADRQQGV
jgi:RNA polymerase-binding protein DksA